jgi:uncharacterized protein
MQISNEQEIAASPEVAWRELNTVEVLEACIPGCESVTRTGPSSYEAQVVTKIGPIKAKFLGKVEIEEIEPLSRYRISGAGKGGIAGFANGAADVTLSEITSGTTLLSYEIDAKIGGKIAQIGSRMVRSVVERMAEDFFTRFGAHLEQVRGGQPVEA